MGELSKHWIKGNQTINNILLHIRVVSLVGYKQIRLSNEQKLTSTEAFFHLIFSIYISFDKLWIKHSWGACISCTFIYMNESNSESLIPDSKDKSLISSYKKIIKKKLKHLVIEIKLTEHLVIELSTWNFYHLNGPGQKDRI